MEKVSYLILFKCCFYNFFLITADSDEDVTYVVPGTVREEFPPRRTLRPGLPAKKPSITPATATTSYASSTLRPPPSYAPIPTRTRAPAYVPTSTLDTTTRNIQNVIQNAHPQDNEIADSVNIRHNQSPNVNVPFSVENSDHKDQTKEAKLNLGAIVALGAFGGFVFLAAVITTIVILVRR